VFAFDLKDLSGHFRYRGNRLELSQVQARHLATRVSIEYGTVDLSPGGGFYADLKQVRGNPIFPTDGFLDALPQELQTVFNGLQLKDPVAIQTRLVVAQKEEPGSLPDVYWDGQMWLKQATLNVGLELEGITGTVACVGRHNGRHMLGLQGNIHLAEAKLLNQPFKNVYAKLQIPEDFPDIMLVSLDAPVFGGEISGEGRVDFNSVLRYEMKLVASQLDLAQLSRHNMNGKTELKGLAFAQLHLTGQGTNGMDSLDGNGTLNIPEGKLYNLPFLLDLLKFLGLRWPDRTLFEQAHAKFSIHGPRLTFQELELWGNVVSLKGKGSFNVADGSNVNLEMYPSWARVEQLLPWALKEISPAVSKNLLKIEVKGKFSGQADDLKFLKRPVPIITEPLMDIRDRVVTMQKKES
jgi:hypothetical protein